MNSDKFFVESSSPISLIVDQMKYDWLKSQVEYTEQRWNFVKDPTFDINQFASKHGYKISQNVDRYGTASDSILFKEDILIKFEVSSRQNSVIAFSTKKDSEKIQEQLFAELKIIGSMIEWVISPRGESVTVPLQSKKLIESAYPWIDVRPRDYIKEYFASDASILILIGPPGTGKTSLIRNIIEESRSSAMITYDEQVMSSDSMFSTFIEGAASTIVFEDADNFLRPRSDGNSMMHRFLNVGDGLLSSKNKKMIFSTNLPNVSEIEPALTRPGRCFDILQSRFYTREEANKILHEIGSTKDISSKNEWSLAELTNQSRGVRDTGRRVGFY